MMFSSFWIVLVYSFLPICISWHAYDPEKYSLWQNSLSNCQRDYLIEDLLQSNVSKNDNYSERIKQCPCYDESTKPYPFSFFQELSLWPNLMSHLDIETGQTIYGSKLALELIWRNQNPPDCKKAKYLISAGWPYGFGSRVHMEGLVLAAALNLGRVYLPHPDGDNVFWETKIPFCRTPNAHDESLTCFYTKLSKCTIADALEGTSAKDINGFPTISLGHLKDSFEGETGLRKVHHDYDGLKSINVVMTTGLGYDGHRYLPHQLLPLLHCSPMRDDSYYYWWRAVAAAYFVRPNERTKSLLASLPTQHPFSHHDYEQCVSMFVRHGDKGIDMKLLPFQEYASIAQYLWNRGLVPASYHYLSRKHPLAVEGDHNLTGSSLDASDMTEVPEYFPSHGRHDLVISDESTRRHLRGRRQLRDQQKQQQPEGNHWLAYYDFPHPIPFNGTMFITTEDPKVLDEAEEFGRKNHWKIVYTNLFDRASQTAYKTWDEQHKRGTVAVHDNLEYLSMLFNFQLSTQCEAWVCNMPSNSCRLMDELRATIGGKANRFYADISAETCEGVPCVANHGRIKGFGE